MKPPETSLKGKITSLIARHGPINISHFIDLCLHDAQYGYYHHANPFGGEGDFITAPEVSQMFGEMLAAWCVGVWVQIGCPKNFVFCEAGPGRGTLMDDMLRTIKKLKADFLKNCHIILIETSDKLRRQIAEKLAPHAGNIKFIEHIAALPPCPLILIANEWLDCLPIQQYQRQSGGWYERMIALDETENLCFALNSHPIEPTLLPPHALSAPIGNIIEISPIRKKQIKKLSHHILEHRGAALLIDYGSLTHGFGDTLQAMSKHNFHHPLLAPGDDDLTSHVDFAALAEVSRQAGCNSASMTQGEFLQALGIDSRARRLCEERDAFFQQKTMQALERLTSPQQMGELFKVFCLNASDDAPFPFH